jgi:surfactin synthase thioesterase subunit
MNQVPLVCIPFAGAGASFFHPWNLIAPDEIKIAPMQLPGRERRIAEEPCRSAVDAVNGLFHDVAGQFTSGGPVILFGHSLGAVLAFELARRMSARPDFEIVELIVSGSPGPWARRGHRATGLPDDEFLGRVQEFAGYRHEALEDPEVRDLILPTLRADVEMHENYWPGSDDPLPVPITSIRGSDDHLVTAAEAAGWHRATSRGFERTDLPGGHMYLARDPAPILQHALAAARRWANAGRGRDTAKQGVRECG